MELSDVIRTQGFGSAPGEDRGKNFVQGVTLIKERALLLKPEDRGIKAGAISYAGIQPMGESFPKLKAHAMSTAGGMGTFALTDSAFFQMAGLVGPSNGERLNFPGYLRACLAHDERLVTFNLMAWLQANKEKQMLMRTVKPMGLNVVRAFLSEKYAPVDDIDVMDILAKLPEALNSEVRVLSVDEGSFHLKLSWRSERREVKKGDVVEFGVSISNSEVGRRAVRIEPMVWRLNCANGLIGRAADLEGGVWYVRHSGNVDRVLNVVGDAMRASLPAARLMAEQFSAAAKLQIDRPVERMKALAKEENLSEAFISNAVEEMLREAGGKDVTKYDFINGVTGAGRKDESADSRYDLERLGGQLLGRELPLPLISEEKSERRKRGGKMLGRG